jgi:predicted amidohydrolase
LLARAIENQAFVVGVNRVGKDGKDLIYSGDSRALSPLGMDLFESTPHKEFVKTVSLNYAELNEVREKLNFLKDVVR